MSFLQLYVRVWNRGLRRYDYEPAPRLRNGSVVSTLCDQRCVNSSSVARLRGKIKCCRKEVYRKSGTPRPLNADGSHART
jgi:hypothetical protein